VPGIGLGLNLAKNLIAGMNGTIEVESKLGAGTKFIVRLPLWEEDKKQPTSETKILKADEDENINLTAHEKPEAMRIKL